MSARQLSQLRRQELLAARAAGMRAAPTRSEAALWPDSRLPLLLVAEVKAGVPSSRVSPRGPRSDPPGASLRGAPPAAVSRTRSRRPHRPSPSSSPQRHPFQCRRPCRKHPKRHLYPHPSWPGKAGLRSDGRPRNRSRQYTAAGKRRPGICTARTIESARWGASRWCCPRTSQPRTRTFRWSRCRCFPARTGRPTRTRSCTPSSRCRRCRARSSMCSGSCRCRRRRTCPRAGRRRRCRTRAHTGFPDRGRCKTSDPPRRTSRRRAPCRCIADGCRAACRPPAYSCPADCRHLRRKPRTDHCTPRCSTRHRHRSCWRIRLPPSTASRGLWGPRSCRRCTRCW